MNNPKRKDSILAKPIQFFNSLNYEAKGNAIVFMFIIAATVISIIGLFFAFIGLYRVNTGAFSLGTIIYIISTISIFILIRRTKGAVLSDVRCKYYMLAIILLCSIIHCSMLYFHTTIMLIIPFLLAFCYKSTRFELIIAFFTGVLIIVTPYLAYYFGGIDSSFPMWYVSIVDKDLFNLVRDEVLATYDVPIEVSPELGLLMWVVVPRLLMVSGMVLVMLCGNSIQRKSYEKRIYQIKFMQDNILEGLAEVIENRDIETGGHVKRTQQVVEILVSKLKNTYDYDSVYWENVIKSAAMHDLGKIAISDTILNKPGKLTDEEFAFIKLHPEKSVEIIDRILKNVEDDKLLNVAKNIALYHHEKFDGKGYPTGISGEKIPLEARIMAIADVFDALVSKRVYKEAFSYEKAHEIIVESMGSHFDPALLPAFEASFPDLVSLYNQYSE